MTETATVAAEEAPVAVVVEPVSTLPSGDVVDTAAPPASMPPLAKSPPISAVLAAAPSHADALVARLFRCLQTRAGTDVVLMFVCYFSRFTGAALESLSRTALRHSAQRLVAMAFKLPPSTTVVLSSAPAPPAAAFALQLGGQFKALAGLLGEMRTMGRLWGLVGLYFSLKNLVLKARAGKSDEEKKQSVTAAQRFDTLVSWIQVLVLIVYQGSENLALLGSKKVLNIKPVNQGKLALLSVRCWGTYVGMELGRLLIERSRKIRSGEAVQDAAWAVGWNKSFLRNLAWAPLTINWSIPNGPLPDIMIGLFGLYPSSSMLIDLWRANA